MQLVSGRKPAIHRYFPGARSRLSLRRVRSMTSGRSGGTGGLWHRHEQAASAHELDRQGRGLDLDPSVAEPDVERHARRDAGLLAELSRDHEAPGGINGVFMPWSSTSRAWRILVASRPSL